VRRSTKPRNSIRRTGSRRSRRCRPDPAGWGDQDWRQRGPGRPGLGRLGWWRGAVGGGGAARLVGWPGSVGWGGAARLAGVAWRGWPGQCGRSAGWRGAVDRARAAGRCRGRAPGRGHRSGWPRTWPWSVCVLSRPVGSARSAATAVATAGATAMASGVVMATWWPFVGPPRRSRGDLTGPTSEGVQVPDPRRCPGTVRRLVGGCPPPSPWVARPVPRPGSRATQGGGKPVPRAVPDRPPGGLATDPRARPSAVSGCSERGPSPSLLRVRRDRLGHQLPIEVGTRVDLWLSSWQRSAYAGLADRQSRPLCGVCIWVRPPLRVSYRGWCWARSFLGAVVPRGLVAYAANV
jgi:hypothetical protein